MTNATGTQLEMLLMFVPCHVITWSQTRTGETHYFEHQRNQFNQPSTT